MKKIKILVLFIPFLTLLSSCGFVSYVETNNQDNTSMVDNEKNDYLTKLENLSDDDLYNEAERSLYMKYLIEAKAEILESSSADAIKDIYNKYATLIGNLKTTEDYNNDKVDLNQYKSNNIRFITNYLDLSLYRENESASIRLLINEYIDKINNALDNKSVDDLVIEYKVNVYPFKTDEELYKEELEELINESIIEINNYKNISNYRQNEVLLINQLIDSFNNQVIKYSDKELVTDFITFYKELLDSVKTDKMLYEEERLNLVEECYNELIHLINLDNLDEVRKKEYIEKCDNIKSIMLSLNTKEAVKAKLLEEKQMLYDEDAKNGNLDSLYELQALLSDNLNNYLDLSLYREEQQVEVKSIIRHQTRIINAQDNYDDTIQTVNKAKDLLDNVLTNDEMWLLYYEDLEKYIDELTSGKKLEKTVDPYNCKNWHEVGKVFDYYAYYSINNPDYQFQYIRLKMNFDYKQEDVLENIYCNSELFVTNFDIDYYFDNAGYLIIKLNNRKHIFYDKIERIDSLKEMPNKAVYFDTLLDKTNDRNIDFSDFPLYKGNKNQLYVENSQQLWYALENGYIPLCKSNSMAEIVFNECKKALIRIIKNDMDDYEKIFVISNYLNELVNPYFEHPYSYYAEGILFYGCGICQTYARAMLILLSLEGIDCKIDSAYNSINTMHETDHNYNYVYSRKDGLWYLLETHQDLYRYDRMSYVGLMNEVKRKSVRFDNLSFATSYCKEFWSHLKYSDNKPVIIECDKDIDFIIDYYNNNSNFQLQIYYNYELNILSTLKEHGVYYIVRPENILNEMDIKEIIVLKE